MLKKIKNLTIKELNEFCEKQKHCFDCPLNTKHSCSETRVCMLDMIENYKIKEALDKKVEVDENE